MRLGRPLIALWAVLVFTGFLASAPFPRGTVPRAVAVASLPASPDGVPGPSLAALPGPSLAALPGSWAAHARACAWAVLLAAAAWSSGRLLVPFMRLPLLPAAGTPVIGGLVACGTGVLALGLAGLAYPAILRIVALVLACMALPAAAARLRQGGRPGTWGLGLAGTTVAGAWAISALNPEPGIDAYLYHLRLPFIYLLHHKVHHVWHHIHSQVPQVWELLLVAVPPVDAAASAQVLSALCAIPVAALTLAFGAGAPGSGLAAALLVSSPLLVSIGTSAYTDLPLVWLGAASVELLVVPHAAPSAARRFAAGAVLGAASALKYSAFPVVAAAGAWLIAGSVRRRDWKWGLPAAAGLLAVFAPWMAWNWLAAGNPVDPFLGRWFADALPALPFADRLSGAVFRRPLRDILASPWSAYIASEPFLFVSPWIVAAVPALALDARARGFLAGAGLWLAVCAGTWAVLIADERFLLPAAPLAVGLLARAGWFRMPAWAAALLLAVNLGGTFRQVLLPLPRLWAAAGLLTRPDYVRGTLLPSPGYSDAAEWLNGNTGSLDRVLVVSDCKSHLVWRECVTDHVYDYPTRLVWILWGTPLEPERVAARFRQLGIRWVLHLPGRSAARLADMPDLFEFRPGQALVYARFWERYAVRAWTGHEASISRVAVHAGPPVPVADLPGVQEVMEYSARLTLRREGPAAVIAEVRRYAGAYPRVAAVRRLAGDVMLGLARDSLTRAEGEREIGEARRIEARARGEQ